MFDAVGLERLGIPTVTFVTAPFERPARATAVALGLSDLRIVVIPHDYLVEAQDSIDAKVDATFDAVTAALFAA